NGKFKSAVEYILQEAADYFKSALVYHKNIMYTIFAVCLFCVVINMIKSDKNDNVYELMLVCAISSIMTNIYIGIYNMAVSVLQNLVGFMNVSLPVYFGVAASVTNKLPFSVYGVLIGFVAAFQWGATNIIFPAVSVMTVCSVLDSAYPTFGVSAVKRFVSNSIHWLLGLYTTIFIGVLKITQIAAYGTDKLIMSGIKYTISHSIPVVGSFLSEAAGAVVTSTLILHNSVGLASVIIVASIALVPFVSIFAVSVIIKFIASVMSPLSCSRVTEVVYCFGECICELSIVLLCACVTFIIGIGIELTTLR
ncbi:MAG: hypothetical protein IJ365_08570, partial [Clostridia bacterium]|nr:hypothetical protein [Clostridia bacterium]